MEKKLLEELYRRYGQEIYRYLYAICRDRFLAEDILQDAFCKSNPLPAVRSCERPGMGST